MSIATFQTEADLQRAVTDLAQLQGWRIAHFRPGQTAKGNWVTAVAYQGKGFPDLVLVRERVVFAELKGPRGRVSPEQREWIADLQAAGVDAYVWSPADWDEIVAVLTEVEGVGS